MRLVNTNTLMWDWNWSFVSPLEFLRRVPKHAIEKKRVFILDLVSSPSRISIFPFTVFPFNLNLVFGVVGYFWSAVAISFDCEIEATKTILFTHVLVPVPLVEISEEFHAFCVWGPLFESEVSVRLKVQAIFLVTSADF